MNRLMMIWGAMPRYMDEAGGEGGGAPAGGAPDGGNGGGAPAAGGESGVNGDPSQKGEQGGEVKPPAAGGESANGDEKPFLGEGEVGEDKPPAAPEVTEQSFIDGIKPDAKNEESKISFDEEALKALAPVFKETGVSVENASKIANAFAQFQQRQYLEARSGRIEYFKQMKEAALKKYDKAGFRTINSGIDAAFKKGGIMNNVIRSSELGADPEFLALMYDVGKRSVTDTGDGGATGGGSAAADPNSIDGLAKMW